MVGVYLVHKSEKKTSGETWEFFSSRCGGADMKAMEMTIRSSRLGREGEGLLSGLNS